MFTLASKIHILNVLVLSIGYTLQHSLQASVLLVARTRLLLASAAVKMLNRWLAID